MHVVRHNFIMIGQIDEVLNGLRLMKVDGIRSLDYDIVHYIPSSKIERRPKPRLSGDVLNESSTSQFKNISKKRNVYFQDKNRTTIDDTVTASDIINGRVSRKTNNGIIASAADVISQPMPSKQFTPSIQQANPLVHNLVNLLEQKEREASSRMNVSQAPDGTFIPSLHFSALNSAPPTPFTGVHNTFFPQVEHPISNLRVGTSLHNSFMDSFARMKDSTGSILQGALSH